MVGRVLGKKLGVSQSRGQSYPILGALVGTLEHASARSATSVLKVPVEATVMQSRVERVAGLIDTLPAPGLFTVMTSGRGDVGLVGLDATLVDHVVGILAGGEPGAPQPSVARVPTAIDAALCARLTEAVVGQFIKEVAALAGGTALARLRAGQAENMPANLTYLLPDQQYLAYRIGLEIGDGGRKGDLHLAVPLPWIEPAETVLSRMRFVGVQGESENWSRHMRKVVGIAPLRVSAVIDRRRMQVAELTRLEVGGLLPLADAAVEDVTLMLIAGADAHPVGRGRLGILRHNKAIRLTDPPDPAYLGPLIEALAAGGQRE